MVSHWTIEGKAEPIFKSKVLIEKVNVDALSPDQGQKENKDGIPPTPPSQVVELEKAQSL